MDKKVIKFKLEKIVVNVGLGRMSQQGDFKTKLLPAVEQEIAAITGQKGKLVHSKQAISGFKLRIGQVIGMKVTLRNKRAVDFLDRLINIVLPRIKDFRGLSRKSIDKAGILNIGLKDQLIFPEIVPEDSKVNFGFEITIVPKSRDYDEALEFYKELNVPFQKEAKTKKHG